MDTRNTGTPDNPPALPGRSGRRGRRGAPAWLAIALWLGTGLVQVVQAADGTGTPTALWPLVRAALAQHPSVQAAGAEDQAARYAVDGARWQFFPTPSLSVEQAATDDPAYAGDPTVFTLGLQQPLWTGGRLRGELARSRALASESGAALDEARQALALAVIQAFGDWQAAVLKVAAYERSAGVHARLLAQVQRRANEGASALSDVALAESRYAGVQAEQALALSQAESARLRLAALAGQATAPGATPVAGTAPEMLSADAGTLVAQALAVDPALRRQQARHDALASEIRMARSRLAPEIYVRAEYQHGDFFVPGQEPQSRAFIGAAAQFGPGLSNGSAVSAARHRHEAAGEDARARRLAVEEQVRVNRALLASTRERARFLAGTVASADGVLASWERQFLAGRKQWQDVMNAARELAQAEAQHADALASQDVIAWRLAVQCRGLDALLDAGDSPGATLP